METKYTNSGHLPGDSVTVSPRHPVTLSSATLSPAKIGMLCFLSSEAAFFGTLIMAYVYFLRKTKGGSPSPTDPNIFSMPQVLASSACLFSSSLTIHLADRAFRRNSRDGFLRWWGLTILLGMAFLTGTGLEWADLIRNWHLAISTNMFGTTYFTLVGFHAAHVTIGLIILFVVFCLVERRKIGPHNGTGVELVSWYWHFVDGVWVVVFSLVYLIGR